MKENGGKPTAISDYESEKDATYDQNDNQINKDQMFHFATKILGSHKV